MIDREKLVSEMQALIALGPYQGVAAERIMQCMKDAVTLLSLTKPASSPAGGDVVREALEAYHDAYSDRRFAPEGSHEAYDAAARLEDAHDLASRALSQSTSAGRGE